MASGRRYPQSQNKKVSQLRPLFFQQLLKNSNLNPTTALHKNKLLSAMRNHYIRFTCDTHLCASARYRSRQAKTRHDCTKSTQQDEGHYADNGQVDWLGLQLLHLFDIAAGVPNITVILAHRTKEQRKNWSVTAIFPNNLALIFILFNPECSGA